MNAITTTTNNKPLAQNAAAVYLAGLRSELSRRTMKAALDKIASFDGSDSLSLDWSQLRYQHTAAIRAQLARDYAPATANKMLSALRGVLKEAWRLGQMSAEDYQRAVDIANIEAQTLPAGRDISSGEIKALVDACAKDAGVSGIRDAAIIGLLATCGLRRAELVAIDVSEFNLDTGEIVIHGKRNKDRKVYATNGTLAALQDWITIRGTEQGALFNPINKSGIIQRGKAMTAQAVYKMLAKRGKDAGVKDFSPHDFRRTVAGDLLDAGVDIAVAARILGHANVQTTARYDRRPEQVKKQASARLHYPYTPRK